MKTIQLYTSQIRASHWIKNILILAPPFFSLAFPTVILDREFIFTFFSFCSGASLIYIINDIFDFESDVKNLNGVKRPYAAGLLSFHEMKLLLIFHFVLTFLFIAMSHVLWPLLLYILSNLAYSVFLKKIPILDILVLALGFECRIWAGASAMPVDLSNWLIIMVLFLSLFFAFSKRRTDVLRYHNTNRSTRENISFYNRLPLFNILLFLGLLIIFIYSAYCFSPEVTDRLNRNIYASILFVVAGVYRYLFLIRNVYWSAYPTEIIWQDRYLQIVFLAWFIFLYLVIY